MPDLAAHPPLPEALLEANLLEFVNGYILANIDVVSALWAMFPLDSLSYEDTVALIFGVYLCLEALPDLGHDLLSFVLPPAARRSSACRHRTLLAYLPCALLPETGSEWGFLAPGSDLAVVDVRAAIRTNGHKAIRP